ncbi:MAG: sigma-54 dependent transcriptional regulator [Paludibacter sp.]|nr:sigma-54 dependent transcriptional regulator [Paludibacter sp.]MDD4198170.1 sigma-54 dependent transcriptional regulator [Paludibacter sp.]MDD4426874.1 sigma-54 dependent transcriptional regulator [Paludibacter sp.]
MQYSEIQAVKQRYGIIGNSELLNRAIDIAVQVAATDLSVLITGESGVGKENFPQIIHQYSHRKHGPYIPVNCGAIPEGTIDSELFGHEKGSFTGATADRKGYFEVADGGTIFLDEVGELPLSTQVRLLRVLEAGEFIKVGSSKIQKTNVRVVAATNREMKQAIKEGRFREDLYYRLNTVPIFVPPLRERKEDIVLLFRKFASDFADRYRMPPIKLTDDAKAMLTNYYWNGNIRQLKNITEQISVIEQHREISSDILKNYLPNEDMERLPALFSAHQPIDQKTFSSEREILYQVLFDMKKDMNELKKLVHDIMNGQPASVQQYDVDFGSPITEKKEVILSNHDRDIMPDKKYIKANSFHADPDDINYMEAEVFQDVEAVHEPVSLQEMEKQMIRKTLEKHRGRRKAAAEELKISERTLYRKIKEYGLD